jgi:SsrA-binding protein
VSDSTRKVVCSNRKARHRFHIEETIEAGIELRGPEVKSLRGGGATLTDSYARVKRGEVFLSKVHIAPYEQASRENPDPERDRKLLLHRREIDRLNGKVRERGLTLIPLEIYFKDGKAKVTLALARGKRTYDRRQEIVRREAERQMERVRKRSRQGRRR